MTFEGHQDGYVSKKSCEAQMLCTYAISETLLEDLSRRLCVEREARCRSAGDGKLKVELKVKGS